ncbi:MAG: sulfite oxidase heme-binding subunit YedZ [Gammaproteobacteria bacterium]
MRRWELLRYALHASSALPLAWLLAAALGLGGQSLGADPVEKLLRETGWWGLTLLVASLAVTPLRVLSGRNPVLSLRRPLGLWGFAYATLHFTIYLVLDRQLAWTEIVGDLAKRPYIMAGMGAVLALIPLAATSTARAMRALGRRWQTLHQLAYVAAVLAVLHFALQVKKDLAEPMLYATALTVLLGWRVWRRLRRERAAAP